MLKEMESLLIEDIKTFLKKILDEKYNELKSGVEMFKGKLLENIFLKLLVFLKRNLLLIY